MKREIKRKVLMVSFIILVFMVILYFYFHAVAFPVNAHSLKISDISIEPSQVTFTIDQLDSGYYLKNYKLNIKNDGTLQIKFYGTLFKRLSLSTVDNIFTITGITGVTNVVLID